MRKKITLILSMLFLGFSWLNAQEFILVSGFVTNENTNQPVAGQEVNIEGDSAYINSDFTNEAGFYIDTVTANTFYNFIHISTLDYCSMMYIDTVIYNPAPNSSVVADFLICTDSINTQCEADFYYMADSNNPYIINFYDNSFAGSDISSWSWSFGDGSVSTEQNPVKTYSSPGTYEVCLTITAGECSSVKCMEVLVENGNVGECQADFIYVSDSLDPATIHFYDQSTPEGQIASWYWVFGEGAISTEQNPVFSFGEAGTYNVCLTITSFNNEVDSCTSTYCMDVAAGGNNNTFTLGGNTFAGIYQLDAGYAYACKMEEGNYTEVYSQEMDSLGYYIFDLLEGNYITKVEPTQFSEFYDTYLPTYYGDVIHWEEAEQLNLNQNIFNADINLVELTQTVPGEGLISGHIMHEDDMRAKVPASDIQVMLANSLGEYTGIKYTDEEGYFAFDNLANGAYTLYAEVMGKSIVPKDFSLTEENQTVEDIVMVISETAVVFGIEDIASAYVESISDIYPNPVKDEMNADINLKEATELQLNIINTTGQIVFNKQFDLQTSQSIQINTADLNPGIYIIEFTTEDQYSITRRLIKY